MSIEDTESYIHSQKGSTRSVDEQISIANAMRNHKIGPDHDGHKADDVEDELGLDLDFAVRTSLGHLEEIGLVEEFIPPGPETLVIATWRDDGDGEVVNGEVTEAAEEGLDAIADDVASSTPSSGETAATDGSGVTLQGTLAREFDLVPNKVEDFLRTTDRQVDILNGAVEAIEDEDDLEVGDDYGEIIFINMPYRYRLTEKAIRLYER